MKWDLDYLKTHLGPGPFAVFVNSTLEEAEETFFTDASNPSSTVGSESQDSINQMPSSPGKNYKRRRGLVKKNYLFKYYDEKKIKDYKGSFSPKIIRQEVSFEDFLKKFNGDR